MQTRDSRAVVHCTREGGHDVYIGRPSKWGNPFVIGRDGDRTTVIEKYEAWLDQQPELLASLHELDGKVLGCWCAPLPCHGDVLSRRAADAAALLDPLRGRRLTHSLRPDEDT